MNGAVPALGDPSDQSSSPASVTLLIAAPLAGRLGRSFGHGTPLALGCAASVVSSLMFIAAHSEPWHLYAMSAMLGLAVGLAFSAMANLIIDAVPSERVSVGTAVNAIFRTVGAAVGTQVAATVVTTGAGVSGFETAFGICALASAFALAATVALPATSVVAGAGSRSAAPDDRLLGRGVRG